MKASIFRTPSVDSQVSVSSLSLFLVPLHKGNMGIIIVPSLQYTKFSSELNGENSIASISSNRIIKNKNPRLLPWGSRVR